MGFAVIRVFALHLSCLTHSWLAGIARRRSILLEPHHLIVRVYYEDTDFSGVVYHASYLRFLERGRTEFLRALGIEHNGNFSSGDAGRFLFRGACHDDRVSQTRADGRLTFGVDANLPLRVALQSKCGRKSSVVTDMF